MDLWAFLCKAKHSGTSSEASFACFKKNTLKYVNFSVLCFDPGAGCLRTLILFNCHQSSYRVCCNSEHTAGSPHCPVAPVAPGADRAEGTWCSQRHSLHCPAGRAELWAELSSLALIR